MMWQKLNAVSKIKKENTVIEWELMRTKHLQDKQEQDLYNSY